MPRFRGWWVRILARVIEGYDVAFQVSHDQLLVRVVVKRGELPAQFGVFACASSYAAVQLQDDVLGASEIGVAGLEVLLSRATCEASLGEAALGASNSIIRNCSWRGRQHSGAEVAPCSPRNLRFHAFDLRKVRPGASAGRAVPPGATVSDRTIGQTASPSLEHFLVSGIPGRGKVNPQCVQDVDDEVDDGEVAEEVELDVEDGDVEELLEVEAVMPTAWPKRPAGPGASPASPPCWQPSSS